MTGVRSEGREWNAEEVSGSDRCDLERIQLVVTAVSQSAPYGLAKNREGVAAYDSSPRVPRQIKEVPIACFDAPGERRPVVARNDLPIRQERVGRD